jgi:putative transposase
MLRFCQQIMRKACGGFQAGLRQFNGQADHVHLLVRYSLKVPVSALVNPLKAVSARRLHRQQYTRRVNRARMNGHFWSPSYFAASCGGAPLSIIRQYIEQQQRPARRPATANPALKNGACAAIPVSPGGARRSPASRRRGAGRR